MSWQNQLVMYKRSKGREIENHIKATISPACTNFGLTYCRAEEFSIVTYYLDGIIHVGAVIYYDHSEPCVKHRYIYDK